MPDCLTPPNGATAVLMTPVLLPTMPTSSDHRPLCRGHGTPSLGGAGIEHARRLAGGTDDFDAVEDDLLYLRVARLAEQAHRCGQVRGAEEDAVHAFRGGDGGQVLDALLRLDLQQHAHLVVGALCR